MAELWDIRDENGNITGRLHERGKPMRAGDRHLVVHVWILNSRGEFLISKRVPEKHFGGLWEMTGGSAVAGDDSITTALKETREEIGISLTLEGGKLFMRYSVPNAGSECGSIYDVRLFCHDCDISAVTLQPAETCDAK